MFEDVDIYLKDLAKWTGQATDECERGLKLLRKVQKATHSYLCEGNDEGDFGYRVRGPAVTQSPPTKPLVPTQVRKGSDEVLSFLRQ